MKFISIFSLFSLFSTVSCFHHFHTLDTIRNKYVKFFDERPDINIYDNKINFYVGKVKVIEENKDLYVRSMDALKNFLKLWERDARIEISNVSILPDRFLIEWIYFCSLNIKLYGTSLYTLNRKTGKVEEHTLEMTNIRMPKRLYYYTHPTLWKPIKIRKE